MSEKEEAYRRRQYRIIKEILRGREARQRKREYEKRESEKERGERTREINEIKTLCT